LFEKFETGYCLVTYFNAL